MIDWLDYAIFGLGVLFVLVGALLLLGNLRPRSGEVYAVGRLEARRSAQRAVANGFGLLGLGAVLLLTWFLFRAPPDPGSTPAAATATAVAQQPPTPTTEPTPTSTITPSPIPPTSTPSPTPAPSLTPTQTLTPSPTPTPLAPDGAAAVVNSVDGLNLRRAPGGDVLTLLDDGATVTLLDGYETSGDFFWRRVRAADGTEGWVAERFLIVPTATPEP